MHCEETQRAFSLYLDGELTHAECASVEAHLGECPVCRLRADEMRALVRGLSLVERTPAPPDLHASIRSALSIERAALAAQPAPTASGRFAHWLQPHLMPYAVGAFYSVLLFVAVFGALRQQLTALRYLAEAERIEAERVTWVGGGEGYDPARPLSPANYAAGRSPFSVESPSINPRGALARMIWSPSPSSSSDDDMTVVADVYGNGRASLAAVVEPPRNPHALDELQNALRKNPAFVPASYDGRPQTMRVVFVLQKMSVEDRNY